MTADAQKWQFHLPVNIVFGWTRAAEVGALAKPYGTKALVVTGRNSTKKSGLLDRMCASLSAAGVESLVFDEVQQNPLTTTAEKGAAVAKTAGCDMVVAVGGGSVIDCAKGIAFLSVNDGDISDYIFARRSSNDALPLVAVPTTCGTGSEGNGFAVLTNPANGDKKSLRCSAIIPKVSVVDPALMTTIPARVLASVGFDALCHCMEAYTAVAAQPFTDALAIYAIKLLAEHLPPLYQQVKSGQPVANNHAAWEAVSTASTIGGICIGACGVTLAHGMEHPASGLRDIVHGQGLAALTPAVISFFVQKIDKTSASAYKLADISRALGGTGIGDCADRLHSLLASLELTPTLGSLGITEADIPWMVENCKKVSVGSLANVPIFIEETDIAAIYKEAL